MKKADMLNIIKDAEERASDLKAKAISEKEKIIFKARNDAKHKIDEGLVNAKAEYDRIVSNAKTEILKDIEILAVREKKQLEEMKITAAQSVDKAANHIVAEFERLVNV